MHERINEHGCTPEAHPRFRQLGAGINRERLPFEFEFSVREALQWAIGRGTLEDAFAHSPVDCVGVSSVGTHGRLSLLRPEMRRYDRPTDIVGNAIGAHPAR